MSAAVFPLTLGQRGEAVRDLQRRLIGAGFEPATVDSGVFCTETERAVARFQTTRGLRATGICDEPTWNALVEASWNLGDRLLLLVVPNLRGDDVAELQVTLARIGFDPGRADGIFGPATARALEDFQHNSGVPVDGVCGPDTVLALRVLTRQTGSGPGVSVVRELATLTATARSLADLRIVVGQFGGLSTLTRQLVLALRQRSATVITSDEPDAAVQAAVANRFGASVYIGFTADPGGPTAVQFFGVPSFESAGGRSLAELIARRACAEVPQLAPVVEGLRHTVLRETRMPAVLVTLGSLAEALDHTPALVDAIVVALESWADRPLGDD